MFDTKSIVPIDNLEFWFGRFGLTNEWAVFKTSDILTPDVKPVYIASYDEDTHEINYVSDLSNNNDITDDQITQAFELFKNSRPEYEIGRPIDNKLLADNADDSAIQDRGYLFEKILTGAIIMQSSCESPSYPDLGIKRAERCIQWLRNTDFYNAPASTRFHESEPGGLLKHTLKVLNQVYQLFTLPAFNNNVKLYEAVIVALAHD